MSNPDCRETENTELRAAFAVVIAVCVSAAILHFTASPERRAESLSAPMFAMGRLLVAHFVAALPLAWLIATRLNARWEHSILQVNILVRLLVAIVLTVGIVLLLAPVSKILDQYHAGFLVRLVARSVIAVAAICPWIIATYPVSHVTTWPHWWLSVFLGLVLPGVYATQIVENKIADFETFAAAKRLILALSALDCLNELGCETRVHGRTIQYWRPHLDRDILHLQSIVAQPLAHDCSVQERLLRATQLLSLSRPDDAELELGRIPNKPNDPNALILRAVTARETRRWKDAERYCCEAIALASELEASVLYLATVHEVLCDSLHVQGRTSEAIAICREAAKMFPDRAASFELQLGILLADRGDQRAAITHFVQAATLDPAFDSRAQSQVRRLRVNGWGCLIRQ